MKKLVVDCSKPIGHPEREQVIDIPEYEKALLLAAAAEPAALAPKPKTTEERLAELEAKLLGVK